MAVVDRVGRLSLYASSIRSTTAGRPGPFGEARVREVDGENVERNAPEQKWPAELSEMPEGPKKPEESRLSGDEFG